MYEKTFLHNRHRALWKYFHTADLDGFWNDTEASEDISVVETVTAVEVDSDSYVVKPVSTIFIY